MNNLEADLTELFAEGVDKVHVLADFDGTLTREYVDGKKTPSIISVLRDRPGYLSPQYQEAAHELYAQYISFEKNADLDLDLRKAKMVEWWTRHKQLLIDSGIRREHLKRLAGSEFIQWREGAEEFLQLMNKLNIPVVILSASGIGEVIPMFCQERGADRPNMYYIVNKFFWDREGRATGFHQPVIHALNKDETAVRDYDGIFQAVKDRVNVLLLGNNVGDLDMSKGFDVNKKVTIGFLDLEEKNRAAEFEKAFDHVVIGGGYGAINKVLERIQTEA